MRKTVAEATLRWGFKHGPNYFTAFINHFEWHGHHHAKEAGLALLYWPPFAGAITVGTYSMRLGWSWMNSHYGPGVSYMMSDNPEYRYWAWHISSKLWYETA